MGRTGTGTGWRRQWPVALVTLMGLWACGGSTPVESGAVELTVSVTPEEIRLGERIQARATVRNASGDAIVITGIRQTLYNVDEDRAILDDELQGELTVPPAEVVTLFDSAISLSQNPPLGMYELIVTITGPGFEVEARDSFVLSLL